MVRCIEITQIINNNNFIFFSEFKKKKKKHVYQISYTQPQLLLPKKMTITIYGPTAGTTPIMCLLTASEAGVDVKAHDINMRAGDHKKPEYIQNVHPLGKVPALVETNEQNETVFKMFESRAICRYLDSIGGNKLSSFNTPQEKAIFEQFAYFEATSVTPIVSKILVERFYAKNFFGREPNEEAAVKAGQELVPFLKVINDQLATTKEYITGSFSLADIYFYVFFNFLRQCAPQEYKHIEDQPELAAWMNRMADRPNVKKTYATYAQ
jgi:glutathione S-transferase